MSKKQPQWKHLLSRRWTILRCELFTKGYVEPLEKYVGVPNRNLLVTKELEKCSLYNSVDSLKEISLALIDKLKKRDDFGKKIYKDCLIACDNLVKVSETVSKGDLSSLKNKALVNRLDKYFRAALDFTPFLALPNNYEMFITGEITGFLTKKVGKKKSEEYLQKLMSLKEYPFQVKEQISLAKIALKIKTKRRIDTNKELDHHKKQFQWLACYNFDEDEFSLSDFKKRLKVLLSLPTDELKDKTENEIKRLGDNELEFQQVIKDLGISGKLLQKIELLREFVFLRTYRIEMNSQSNFYLKPLLLEISKRGNISIEKLSMMLSDEIRMMLKNNSTVLLVKSQRS
jgi:hypothetical protein